MNVSFNGAFAFSWETVLRGGPRTAATSKMERFVIIVNGFQPLTLITKRSILDVATFLDLPLVLRNFLKVSRGSSYCKKDYSRVEEVK